MMIHDPHDLLAAYALDAVENDDRLRVEQHVAHCPRCQAELDGYRDVAAAIGNSVEKYPTRSGPVSPADWLSDRLMVPHPCRCSCALISIRAAIAVKGWTPLDADHRGGARQS